MARQQNKLHNAYQALGLDRYRAGAQYSPPQLYDTGLYWRVSADTR